MSYINAKKMMVPGPVPTPLPGVPGGQKVPFFRAVFGGTFGHPPQNFS